MSNIRSRVWSATLLAFVLGVAVNVFTDCNQIHAAILKDVPVETVEEGVAESTPDTGDTTPNEDIIDLPQIPELEISITSQLEVMKGKTKTISVENAQASDFAWKSSDDHIATVTDGGKVKGVSAGSTTITATDGTNAYECVVKVYASKKYLSEWVLKKGRYYYYNEYGEKVTGRTKIGKHLYYFDSKGRQRVGWIKESGSYYYYKIAKKNKGYMLKDQTVNGIKLKSNGAAKITKKNTDKVRLFANACEVVFDETDWTMTRKEALKTMFIKLARDEIITYKTIGHFRNISQWDVYYANQYFSTGYGDCYTYGSVMAYFALALGYENIYVCSSGRHGWCQIDGLYYDPRFANWGTLNMMDAFAVTDEQCGKGGRMNWKKWSTYKCRVDK